MKKFVRSLTAVAAAALGSASFAATATPTADHIVLGSDWNQPTRCADNNADSLAISEAKVGTTVWQSVNESGLYNWGFFGSSMATPPDVNGVSFYMVFPTMRRWYRYGDGPDQPMADRTPYNPPNANYDYWIGSAGLCTPNDGSVDSHFGANHVYKFEGRSLTIDGTIVHCSKGTSICDFGEHVTIKSGTCSFPGAGGGNPAVRMKATVDGDFKFEPGNYKDRKPLYLDVALTGGAGKKITLALGASDLSANWYWCGDCADYKGMLCVSTRVEASEAHYSILSVSNAVCGGSVEIQAHQHLTLLGANAEVKGTVSVQDLGVFDVEAGTSKVGALDLQGELNFNATTSKVQVNGDITIGETAKIVLPADADRKPLLTFPSSAAFSSEDFIAAIERCESNPAVVAVVDVSNDAAVKTVAVVLETSNHMFDITGDGVMNALDATYRVNVKNGVSLTMHGMAETRMAVNTEEGAEVVLSRVDADWQSLPTLWLDASVATSIKDLTIDYEDSYACYDAAGTYLKTGETICYSNNFPFVRGWLDWRAEQTTVKMWNNRYDKKHPDNEPNFHKSMHGTFPYLVTNGLNGKSYLSFGKRGVNYNNVQYTYADDTTQNCNFSNMSRIFMTKFASDVTVASDCTIKPKYVIMVFGSQMGGGVGLLGDNSTTSKFVRMDGVDNPILPSDTTMTAWVDGQPISSPGTATHVLNGGWQVITLGVNGNSVHGLGYSTSSGSDNGGQNYAEIIFVDQELTERQRQTIEIYLAEKWGLEDTYHYPEWAKQRFATVYGTGTVKLEADAKLGGAFKGTVDLNGNDLVIDGAALPPTEAAIDTTALEGWYDPDAEGKTRESGPTRLDLISLDGSVTNKNAYTIQPELNMIDLIDRNREKTEGSIHLYGQPQRAPWLNTSARAYGPARKWMEFSNLATVDQTLYKGVSDGKVLRFSKVNNAGKLDGNTYQQPMQTLFMVQDSVNGGGHPFADGTTVNAPVLYKSRTGMKSAVGQPIYPTGTADILTKGLTCIDGREVDGLTESFGARPEVLTVVPTEMFTMVAIGQLNNSENKTDGHHEVIGEIMIYNRKLEAAERKVVEAYLSYKWLGLANEGYSDLTAATVTGAGKVTAANAALLPKFGAGFTGTVAVPLADGLAFTLVTDTATTVSGAIDLGGGALEIPAGTTSISISVAKSGAKPKAGSYKLIGWVSKPTVTWNLSLDGWTRESTALRVANDGLYLDLEKVGMTVIVR